MRPPSDSESGISQRIKILLFDQSADWRSVENCLNFYFLLIFSQMPVAIYRLTIIPNAAAYISNEPPIRIK